MEDFSFVLNEGDKAVIIGEEGNGKSTLLKWICDPDLIEPYCQWSGETAGNPGPTGYLAQELTEEEKGGRRLSLLLRADSRGAGGDRPPAPLPGGRVL